NRAERLRAAAALVPTNSPAAQIPLVCCLRWPGWLPKSSSKVWIIWTGVTGGSVDAAVVAAVAATVAVVAAVAMGAVGAPHAPAPGAANRVAAKTNAMELIDAGTGGGPGEEYGFIALSCDVTVAVLLTVRASFWTNQRSTSSTCDGSMGR